MTRAANTMYTRALKYKPDAICSGTPTASTASQTIQNSTNPSPWPANATTEPTKIQASGHGAHDALNADSSSAVDTVPTTSATTRTSRSVLVPVRTVTPYSASLRRVHAHQP